MARGHRNCFAAEFISVGTGFCTNRQKASSAPQKRCSTQLNSVVDEDTGLVKLCLLCDCEKYVDTNSHGEG